LFNCFLLYYAYAAYFWDGGDTARCISAGFCVIIFQYFIILYFFTIFLLIVSAYFMLLYAQLCWFVFCVNVTFALHNSGIVNFTLLLFSILLSCLLFVAKQGPARCQKIPLDSKQNIDLVEVRLKSSQNHVTGQPIRVICGTGDDNRGMVVAALLCCQLSVFWLFCVKGLALCWYISVVFYVNCTKFFISWFM